jgi:DNA-binding XRE family transcriptional regulator
MSSTHGYDKDTFLDEFFPDSGDRSEVEAGAQQLVAANRAHRLAEMRRRLGLTQAEVADRMRVRQERVSAIERAKVDASELRTLAAYVKALGGRLEIVADFGGERLVIG